MTWIYLTWELHSQYIISWMPSSLQSPFSFLSFINRAVIRPCFLYLSIFQFLHFLLTKDLLFYAGNHMDNWSIWENLFWLWLLKNFIFIIPTRSFYFKAVNIASQSWLVNDLFPFIQKSKLEKQTINSTFFLSRVILLNPCKKRLCKVKAWKPENLWSSICNPKLEHSHFLDQVFDVIWKRF